MDKKPAVKPENPDFWRGKEYSFINHRKCESFPCHDGIGETEFNCLFCYCPLYMMDDKCGGAFRYLKNGVKDCSACNIPHNRENYGVVISRFNDIVKEMSERRKES